MPPLETTNQDENYHDPEKTRIQPGVPPNTGPSDYEKTLMNFKNTQMEDGNEQQFKKTMIDDDTTVFINKQTNPDQEVIHPFKRTAIGNESNPVTGDNSQATNKRKLVGWLATFTNDDYGQDYKLYVGKNRIGSMQGADIFINDPSVSGEHLTILFRNNEFLIKDNFSTNGTMINGLPVDEGKIKDGDEIKAGNTVFKFKTVF